MLIYSCFKQRDIERYMLVRLSTIAQFGERKNVMCNALCGGPWSQQCKHGLDGLLFLANTWDGGINSESLDEHFPK